MTSNTTNTSLLNAVANVKDAVEVLGKAALALFFISYGLGLLIVNLHLHSYGVSAFGLMQVEYVFAGFTYMLLVTFVLLSGRYMFHGLREVWRTHSSESTKIKTVSQLIFAVVGLPTLLTQALPLLSDGRISLFHWRGLLTVALIGFTGLAGYSLVQPFRRATTVGQLRSIIAEPDKKTMYDAATQVVALVLGVWLYATYVYPDISPAFAGGRPRRVTIVSTKDYAGSLKLLGFKLNGEITTNPLQVLVETQDFLIVLPESNADKTAAVRLRKDGVNGVMYAK